MPNASPSPHRAFALRGALVAALMVTGAVLLTARAETPAADAGSAANFSPEQRKAIEAIVKDYLINNPDVMLEVQAALEAKMQKAEAEKMKGAITQNAKEIYHSEATPVVGNPNGDITVVEFFDYNCGFCRRGFPEIKKLVDTDKTVRVVMKEFPILSKGSEEAARVALAAKAQGKYWEMHQTLFGLKGQINEAAALAAAEKLGLDMAKLKEDMTSGAVKAELESVQALAQKMGVSGTPHFLIGDRSIGGAPEDLYKQLEMNVTEVRRAGCAYC